MQEDDFDSDAERQYSDLTTDEIYDELESTTDFLQGVPIGPRPEPRIQVLGLGHQKTRQARRLEKFVADAEQNKNPGFVLEEQDDKGTRKLKQLQLGAYFRSVMTCADMDNASHLFSEEVELVIACVSEIVGNVEFRTPWTPDGVSALRGYDYFNLVAEAVRLKIRDAGFLARRRRRREQAKRHYRSGVRYIGKLFKKYSRLLVLRIDLGYLHRIVWPSTIPGNESLPDSNAADTRSGAEKRSSIARASRDRLRADLANLQNNVRSNKMFNNLVGFIWKMEHGASKGYHLHTFLFFKGSERKKHEYMAQKIGDYWEQTITKGDGLAYNCNREWSGRRNCAIGMVDHADEPKRELLLRVLAYVTKADQYLRVRTTEHEGASPSTKSRERIFGTGVVKPRVSAAGRPRKTGRDDKAPKDSGDEQYQDDDDGASEAS